MVLYVASGVLRLHFSGRDLHFGLAHMENLQLWKEQCGLIFFSHHAAATFNQGGLPLFFLI